MSFLELQNEIIRLESLIINKNREIEDLKKENKRLSDSLNLGLNKQKNLEQLLKVKNSFLEIYVTRYGFEFKEEYEESHHNGDYWYHTKFKSPEMNAFQQLAYGRSIESIAQFSDEKEINEYIEILEKDRKKAQ